MKEVNVLTGEENEFNILQLNAKLYLFDKETQNWLERGRGLLRLNDMMIDSSDRNIMRAQGSLRVILNIKLWSGMLLDRASQKSIKISAVDAEEGIKIYLITVSSLDCVCVCLRACVCVYI
uniref:RanBD1 domain-containing protein n=1 Tax=Helobdella robusta TaxID=6412 RepID=T1FY59_HELRO